MNRFEMDSYRFDDKAAERPCKFIELLPHVKGKWALKQELIKLEPWQLFIICNTFGWLHKKTGLRRFRESDIIVPRKNGKTLIGAAIGLYMLAADNEYGSECYCGATSERQAWEIFRPAKEMAQKTPAFIRNFGVQVNASNISISSKNAKFEPVIAKPGDGASPSLGICDEWHEADTSVLYDTLKTGMGSRDQPLMLIITTAGENLAGPCFDLVLQGRKLLEGTIEDETTFYIEFTIDEGMDWGDPASLRMANPNMGVSVGEEFLLNQQQEAIRNPRKTGIFRTKHLNQWVTAKSAFHDMRAWNMNFKQGLKLENYKGKRAYVGLDLASKNDIAAMVVLVPLEKSQFAMFPYLYLPEATIDRLSNESYRAWASEGYIIKTEGNATDYMEIYDDLEKIRKLVTVEEVCFDPSQATMFTQMLERKRVKTFEFTQWAANYSEPMKEVCVLSEAGNLHHNCPANHPFTWQMSNVVSRPNRKDQEFPDKLQPELKIDGPVALYMAMAQAMANQSGNTSVYETRGLRIFG